MADWEKFTLNVSMGRCKVKIARVDVDGELQVAPCIPRGATDRMADVGLLGDNSSLREAPVHVPGRPTYPSSGTVRYAGHGQRAHPRRSRSDVLPFDWKVAGYVDR
jgi:hypothetical protein